MADSPHQGVVALAVSAAELVAGRVPADDAIGLLAGLLDEVDTVRLPVTGARRVPGLPGLPAERHFVVHLGRDGSTACSENVAAVLGDATDLTPRALLSFIRPEDRVAALRAYVETSTGRRTTYGVHLRLRGDDKPHPVLETTFVGMLSASGQRSVVVYGLELTGHGAETERLREVVSRLADAVLVVDETGQVRMTNDALTRLFGERRWTHEREALRALIATCRDVPRAGQRLAALTRAPEHRGLRLDLADGRLVEIERTPLSAGDLPLGAFWQIRDITSRAWPQPVPRDTRPLALAAVSQEMRVPLTAIAESADLLAGINAGRLRLAEEQQRAIQEIGRHTGRMLRLADDLELLSRLSTEDVVPRQEDVRVPELIDDAAVGWTSLAAAENILLTCRTSHGAPLVGDPRFLRRVLDNLIHNALTFSRAGSTVIVSAIPSGPQWTLEVADRGIGIPATDLALVTRPFERATNAVAAGLSGAGLGLPICQKLVELQHGTLTIESAVDIGTTVRVHLPGRVGPGEAVR